MKTIFDEIITDPKDELYDLQKKYNVKISRSGSSNSVYIYRTRHGFRLRIGHALNRNQRHIQNFAVNVTSSNPSKQLVEETIKKYLPRF